jgi:maltose O-acetyltransferase
MIRRGIRSVKRRVGRRVAAWVQSHGDDGVMADRIATLRSRGIQIGESVAIYECVFDYIYPFLITIGNHCTLTGAQVICHDESSILFCNRTTVAPVTICDRVFVGRGAILLPGVTIGPDAIVGAGAIVTSDVPAGAVVAGSPARVIGTVSDVMSRRIESGRLLDTYIPSNLFEHEVWVEMQNEARRRYLGSRRSSTS